MEKHYNIREKTAAAALLQSHEITAARLLDSQTLASVELMNSETKLATEFKILFMRLLSEAEDHRQLMGWMSGQYSVDSSICDDGAERDFDIGALDLKISRDKKAINLKNVHKQAAINLKEFHRNQALELENSQ